MSTSIPSRLLLALVGLLTSTACAYPSFRTHRPPAGTFVPIPVVRTVPQPPPVDLELASLDGIPLIRLTGDGYTRGFQYGRAMQASWQKSVKELEARAVELVEEHGPPRFLAKTIVRLVSAHVVQRCCGGKNDARAEIFFPAEYRAYVQGIADGASIDAAAVQRLIAFVMLSDASCSGFVAFGPATTDGRLIQLRNLDWGDDELPVAQRAVLLVHEPPGKRRYLSIGFVGLVGTVSGINDAGISLTEIGAGSEDWTERGMPMPLLLEKVLAEASTLDEAVHILRTTPGNGGYNYLIGSARERRGAVVEATARHSAVFEIGPDNYADNPVFFGFAGFDARSSTAAAPWIRSLQEDSGGPGSPLGHPAYEERYKRQIDMFEAFGRRLGMEQATEIARAVCPGENVQSVLYDFDRHRVFVRNRAWFKDGRTDLSEQDRLRIVAGAQPPAIVDLRRIFPSRASRADRGCGEGVRSPAEPPISGRCRLSRQGAVH